MPPPPPPKQRKGDNGATGGPPPEAPGVTAAASADSVLSMQTDDGTAADQQKRALQRLKKKAKEAERLVQRLDHGESLCAEEHNKAESLNALRQQIALLEQPSTPPAATAAAAAASALPGSFDAAAASALPTQPASCLAATCAQAAAALSAVPPVPATRVGTRASALAVERQMREQRAALERERRLRAEQVQEAELQMWLVLRAPLASWGAAHVTWQLAMCEFALRHSLDEAATPMQLQLRFRAACEEARHPSEVRPSRRRRRRAGSWCRFLCSCRPTGTRAAIGRTGGGAACSPTWAPPG